MIPFINIHTHFATSDKNVFSIQNFTQNEWENAAFVIARNEATEGWRFASVGLHPWFLTKENGERTWKHWQNC